MDTQRTDMASPTEGLLLPLGNAEARRRAGDLLQRLARIHEEVLAVPEESLPQPTAGRIERVRAMEMREDR